MYKPRNYRRWVKNSDLVFFEVIEGVTDLGISADADLSDKARAAVLNYRRDLEDYIRKDPTFHSSLDPVQTLPDAPKIALMMAEAARLAGVGPMAAVAGAIAEMVGKELLKSSSSVIVENGGDIFLKTLREVTVGIYAGERSPFTGRLAIRVETGSEGIGVCTSSGTLSHSLNFGRADIALVIAQDTALADAVATAAGNAVKDPGDIEKGIAFARSVVGVKAVLITVGEKMGTWGDLKLA